MPSTFAAFIFQANKDIDMKNVATIRDKFIDLYYNIYGFYPSFGSYRDWNDPQWLNRMYDSLYKEYNSLPEEFDLATDFYN